MADALRDVGVYTISRSHRERLASELVAEGVTAAEVVDLAVYLGALISESTKAQRTIAGRLTNADERAQAFRDLRLHRARREELASLSRREHQSTPGETCRREDLERVRAFERAWAQYQDDVATGRVQPIPRRRHPWERSEETADRLAAIRSELESFSRPTSDEPSEDGPTPEDELRWDLDEDRAKGGDQ